MIELLVVISIMGVLAGLIVGLSGLAGRKMRESRVRAELEQLVTAIESYRAEKGFYPPDNPLNPVTNALFYELVGTVITNTSGQFYFLTLSKDERIPAAQVKTYFNVEGFSNADLDPKRVKNFLNPKAGQFAEISSNPDVELLVTPLPWPVQVKPWPVEGKSGLNPWRYSSGPRATNNPGRFDLWAEIYVGGKPKVIGNWKE